MANDDIQGTITDGSGNPVSGATVYLFTQSSPNTIKTTTTDSNGNYIFTQHPDSDGTTQQWYVTAYYDGGTQLYNTLSKPSIDASLGDKIPDSLSSTLDIWFDLSQGSGTNVTADIGSFAATIHGGGWVSGVGYGDNVTTYDGTDDNFFADDSRLLNEPSNGFCGWVKISSSDDYAGLFSAVESNDRLAAEPSDGWRLDTGSGSPRLIHYSGGSSGKAATSSVGIRDNNWYFIGIGQSGDTGSLYIWDTSSQVSSASGSALRTTGGSRYIRAMGGDSGRFVDGLLDSVGAASGSEPSESDFQAIWNDTKSNYQ